MKFLILLSIIFALSFIVVDQEALAILECADPFHCYSIVQSSRSSEIDGIQYELDSPDLWVDRTQCNNIAVSTGWLITFTGEWVESGVTKGFVQNVGCVTLLSTYYAINNIVEGEPVYQEYLLPNGRVDPGDDIEVILQRNPLDTNQIQVFVTTPDLNSEFPSAQLTLNPNNIYFADYGIEGTISAPVDYSSIPMSKFTNLKIKQNDVWIDLPSSAPLQNIDTSEGYIGMRCPDTSFVAGTVMSLDCNVVTVRNQIPLVEDHPPIPITTGNPFTISLNDIDTDKDYLQYVLTESSKNGILRNHDDSTNLVENSRIPNTDGDSTKLVYTPASNPPESDSFRYSVTDKRDGHTREGLITIVGPIPPPAIPNKINDFSYTLDGTTINFDWSEPFDGGSPIENYKVERSVNTVSWNLHNWYTETSFSYDRPEGYDQYFRVFANNANGLSASSNVVNVHIPDSTPPIVTINNPNDGETLIVPDVPVDGFIYEENNSGIEDVKIWLDNIVRPEFTTIDILLLDTSLNFESLLSSVSNGNHLLMVTAENGDGVLGSDNISITVDAPIPTLLDSFEDNFEADMSNWSLATEDDEYWSVRASPIIPVPDSLPGNKIAGTEDCDTICTMTMIDHVDLTQMSSPTLSFYRYVSTSADIPGEGILVYVSEDDGNTWSVLDSFIADDSDDDGLWHQEEYNLGIYSTSTQFKLKFEAISTSNSEDTELDDILIYDASADTTPPIITVPADVIFEATATLTPLDETDFGIATAIDADDPSPVITNDAPTEFLLGDTTIIWTATDLSGNNSTDNQIITLQDTTNPTITLLGDSPQTIELGDIYTELGANATDNIDGDITTHIIIDSSAVDVHTVGTYLVLYDVSDFSGNSPITEFREVIVIQSNPAPAITSLVADDPDDLDEIYSVGDTITITFDSDTNTPGGTKIQTKAAINDMFAFTEFLGLGYVGQWSAPDTFTITIKSVKNAGPPLIDVTTVTPAGIIPILSADQTSEQSSTISPTLSGDFGIITHLPPIDGGPIITSLIADDPNNLDEIYSVGDTITITFDSDTNIPGGTDVQRKAAINDMFAFTEPLGRAYVGQWVTPDTFTITIGSVSKAGPPLIDRTTVVPAGITPILSADQTSEQSSTISPILSGDFGIVP